MINLSIKQAEIVQSSMDGAIQVLASAGSGKTRVLTERVRFILDKTKKDAVIALTFTNKASEEMQERLSDFDAVEDRAWIATIHSVAQRILEKYNHTIGLPSDLHIYERDKDRMELFLQSLRDDGIDIDDYLDVSDTREKRNREKVIQGYMDAFSSIKRELLHQDEEEVGQLFPHDDRVWKIFQDYQRALLDSGGIDFDDILVYAHDILTKNEWIADVYRAKYKHICVDEAQDLNKVQYEFIKALCGDTIKSVMMVGDPNQMIYGFNGSSTQYLCEYFVKDFSPHVFELKENYRSSKAIITVANKLKPNSQDEREAALPGGVTVEHSDDEFSEAAWITSQIKHLLSLKIHREIEGEITLKKMVVIARNRFVFSALQERLNEEKIPYVMKKGERLTESSSLFGKVLDYGVRLKLNNKDWVDGKKLYALLKTKVPDQWGNENALKKLSDSIPCDKIIFPQLQADLLIALQGMDADNPNMPKFIKAFNDKLIELAKTNVSDKHKLELERSADELNEFQRCWTQFKRKGLGESLQAFRNSMALGHLSEESNHDGLVLSTVHTMKGLEKDIVFIIGMCEGVFPDYRAKTKTDFDEERNNAFVAVTRAKRWLYISYPKCRTMPWGDKKVQNRSRFLSEIQA